MSGQFTRHHPEGKTCHHWGEHRLTCDDYDRLRARAAGHCEICGIAEADTPVGKLYIDHAQGGRNTYYVRGLVCAKCNAVMACHDGRKAWGANRVWAERAALYAANSFQPPTQRRTPRIRPDRQREIRLPIANMSAAATKLRERLTPDELAQLVADLAGGGRRIPRQPRH